MIRHIVMFSMLEEYEGKTREEHVRILKEQFEKLPAKIPCIRRLEVGLNDRNAAADNYTLCLTVDVDSLEDLAVYANHPEHLKVAGYLAPMKTGRTCVDYEIEG